MRALTPGCTPADCGLWQVWLPTCDAQLCACRILGISPLAGPRQLRLAQGQAGAAAVLQVLCSGVHCGKVEQQAPGGAAGGAACLGSVCGGGTQSGEAFAAAGGASRPSVMPRVMLL